MGFNGLREQLVVDLMDGSRGQVEALLSRFYNQVRSFGLALEIRRKVNSGVFL